MANIYCQWSEYFPLNSKEEYDWLNSVLSLDIYDYENSDDLSEPELVQKILKEDFGIYISLEDAEFFPDFSKEFNDDHSGVHVYAEEFGNIDLAATIFQAFLKKFRPDSYFKIEWANSCSKPRAGEFGGGAVFVTATEIDWFNTGSWVSKKASPFRE